MRYKVRVELPAGERDFIVYARTRDGARLRIRRGVIAIDTPPTRTLGNLEELGGKVLSVEEYPEMPRAKLIVDKAPSRETRG